MLFRQSSYWGRPQFWRGQRWQRLERTRTDQWPLSMSARKGILERCWRSIQVVHLDRANERCSVVLDQFPACRSPFFCDAAQNLDPLSTTKKKLGRRKDGAINSRWSKHKCQDGSSVEWRLNWRTRRIHIPFSSAWFVCRGSNYSSMYGCPIGQIKTYLSSGINSHYPPC